MERVYPMGTGDERTVLTGFLDWQRATVRWKVEGLAPPDAARSLIGTSPRMTVSGVLSHLAQTEHDWFTGSFPSLVVADVRRVCDGGWDAAGRPLDDLVAAYEQECARSRSIISHLELDTVQEFTPSQLNPVNVRWILTHMIEETARHLGHLDLLREQLDGTRGY